MGLGIEMVLIHPHLTPPFLCRLSQSTLLSQEKINVCKVKQAPQKEADSVQGKLLQCLRQAVPGSQWLPGKMPMLQVSATRLATPGWQGCAMDHEAGQGQHHSNT